MSNKILWSQCFALSFVIMLGCSSFRNDPGLREYQTYRNDLKEYHKKYAQYEKDLALYPKYHQQCIDRVEKLEAEKAEEKRRQEAAEAAERQKLQALKAAYDGNPVVVNNTAVKRFMGKEKSIEKFAKQLGASVISSLSTETGNVKPFEGKAGHCYLMVSETANALDALNDATWKTRYPREYQKFRIQYYHYKSLPEMHGICTAVDTQLQAEVNLNGRRAHILEWSKQEIPDWLQIQMSVEPGIGVCSAYAWIDLWTHPVPGSLYYYRSQPVLRISNHRGYKAFDVMALDGAIYRGISVSELALNINAAEIKANPYQYSCGERKVFRKGVSLCDDRKSSSPACCMTHVMRIYPNMSEGERQSICGLSAAENKSMMSLSVQEIYRNLKSGLPEKSLDISKQMKSIFEWEDGK